MPSGFTAALVELIRTKNLSVREVALAASIEPAYLHRVIKGAKPLAAHHIEPLADAIGLDAEERARFVEAAYLHRADPFVRNLVLRLQAEVTRLGGRAGSRSRSTPRF